MSNEMVLDLDAKREQRAAAREGNGEPLSIKMGGKIVATLDPEFPLDVLEPLRAIDQDLALLLRQAITMAQGGDTINATGLVIDLLASNPRLPTIFLDTLRECAVRLFGEEGVAALIEFRPSREDIGELAKGVSRFYGLSLGEASPSSASLETDGETSSATSSGTTDSTPVASTPKRRRKAS
jgi:hypothetical protein